jgi:hypothetical protein
MSRPNFALIVLISAVAAKAQYVQQAKLTPTNGNGLGATVAVSGNGSTAIVGAKLSNSLNGGAWIYTRANGAWTQQAALIASDAVSNQAFGSSVALSADGNTAAVGGNGTTDGGTWVFTRNGATWTQQGLKILGNGSNAFPGQGKSVALSADGNTLAVGGDGDNFAQGAVWVFTRSGNTWTQQGLKLVGSGATGAFPGQGSTIGLSADGSTLVSGAGGDGSNNQGNLGAAWIFTRSGGAWNQQGAKLVGNGAAVAPLQTVAVAISGDGNTVILGRNLDNNSQGAAWIFTRSGTTWSQQGGKISGNGAVGNAQQGSSVALSGDGNTAAIGGPDDNTLNGAAWIFKRSSGAWNQLGNKIAATGGGFQGTGVALSADSSVFVLGASIGNTWIYSGPGSTTAVPGGTNPPSGTTSTQTFTFTFTDSAGWQNFNIVNILVASALDGRQACYIAFVPNSPTGGSLYLVDDAGDAGGPYSGTLLPGTGTVSNSQCSITGATSLGVADTLTLTLPITSTPSFGGYKVIYTSAGDSISNSGWQATGSWDVPGAHTSGPAVMPTTPPRSTGFSNTYQFTLTDPNGWQDIAIANVLIASAIDGRSACYIAFAPGTQGTGSVYLVDDAGDAGGPFAGGLLLPSNSSVSNSQCTINGAGSSVSGSGNNLNLNLAITFTPAFGGNRILYLAARNGTQNSGWQAAGTASVQ